MKKERIDKLISTACGCSRADAKKLIRQKEVLIDGVLCLSPDEKLDPDTVSITVKGKELCWSQHVYYMMNKPSGVVSATVDKNDTTVIDILPDDMKRRSLFPAGRLDKDTEGLLIITDNGDFAHNMLSPKKHVYKRYLALLDKAFDPALEERFKSGVVLSDGTICAPAVIVSSEGSSVVIAIREGKYHQVKRMFAALGYRVEYLKRLAIGALKLDESLSPGDVRALSEEEKELIFADPKELSY